MDPREALGPRLEEALRRMRARGIPGRSRSFQFGAQTALRVSKRDGAGEVAKYAVSLLRCDDEPPDLPAPLREEAVRDWSRKSPERLDLDSFRLGFYVEMLRLAARAWEERAEEMLSGERQ